MTSQVELDKAVAEIIRLNDEISSLRRDFRIETEALRQYSVELVREKDQLQLDREADAVALANAFARIAGRQH
jgi:hypothetical protein